MEPRPSLERLLGAVERTVALMYQNDDRRFVGYDEETRKQLVELERALNALKIDLLGLDK